MKHECERPKLREAISKCWYSKTRKKFGIVVVSEMGECWVVQHSFLCSDHYIDTAVEAKGKIGQVNISDRYNGCKHCGDKSIVQCGGCKEYCCSRFGSISPVKTFRCGSCGMRGIVSGYAESMNISGD